MALQRDLVPIGSVVRVQDVLLVVVGHRLARDEDAIGLCYELVPYPLGFVNARSLSLMPASRVDDVVLEGLRTQQGDEYLADLRAALEAAEGVGYHEYADAVLAFQGYMNEREAQHG